MRKIIYLFLGIVFGMAMYKAEAASWFRIYEMFSFQAFHMYGFMAVALFIGMAGIQIIKRYGVKDADGAPFVISQKNKSVPRYLIGGDLFGMGRALAVACPGPVFVLLGVGVLPMLVVIAFALLGTYLYGLVRKWLPQ